LGLWLLACNHGLLVQNENIAIVDTLELVGNRIFFSQSDKKKKTKRVFFSEHCILNSKKTIQKVFTFEVTVLICLKTSQKSLITNWHYYVQIQKSTVKRQKSKCRQKWEKSFPSTWDKLDAKWAMPVGNCVSSESSKSLIDLLLRFFYSTQLNKFAYFYWVSTWTTRWPLYTLVIRFC
jgi:hypothetical protein